MPTSEEAEGGFRADFTLDQPAREQVLLPRLQRLTEQHRARCPEYRRILEATGHQPGPYQSVSQLPWLPVGLFKQQILRSVASDEVYQVLTSSGTTGAKSQIHLDRSAAAAQGRALVETMRAVLGPGRRPMLLVDSPAKAGSGLGLSARGAGVLAMMSLGRDYAFVLDEDGAPDPAAVEAFVLQHGHAPFLVFGFTFLVWAYLYPIAWDLQLDLSHGTLVHSGGWKRLAEQAVDNQEFRQRFAETGLRRIHNFYGMVEQMGTVFVEGPSGEALYCPDSADVLIRDPVTWQLAPIGRPGVVQVVSTVPRSYPGHVLLTEDVGVVHGVDDGDWPGRRFTVLGRLPAAAARGCSDTLPDGPE